MRYGFVIDQTRCIGCHACTVACKEENRVALGTFRTWVKYVEKGEFPNTRRHFAVLRCNHCDNAPCVTICPTVALYRRPDGIVDFDRDRCIGCKSCMQACPYDALYIDPETQTAAKCHFCAHRVERGLEPACVIVCPERAILTGDLDDPASEVARVIAREQVMVRKPEQGTRPKLFYVGADHATLAPTLQDAPAATLWGQRAGEPVSLVALAGGWQTPRPAPAVARSVEALGRTVYDVSHESRPWGWRVAAYLWTKSVAAGAALAAVAGVPGGDVPIGLGLPVLAILFLLLTAGLLIVDLKRPDRFHYLLLKPNWRSWLVLGAFILLAFGVVLALWILAAAGGRGTMLGRAGRAARTARARRGGLQRVPVRPGGRARLLAERARAPAPPGGGGDGRRRPRSPGGPAHGLHAGAPPAGARRELPARPRRVLHPASQYRRGRGRADDHRGRPGPPLLGRRGGGGNPGRRRCS